MNRILHFTLLLLSLPLAAFAQRELSGAAEIRLALRRLNAAGSVLMIAAHPDDENTAVLAYFARARSLDTAYLSLTRGEGGQNLIGSEQGDRLGLIRTQELMAARRIDGAQQFFSRAIDFGFSKTAEETMAHWGRERILSDIVWTIRRFRPDIIILRFSGTSRDGHGHHQASAILGKEAFQAAADPSRFPEQLQWTQPWRAKRVLWNVFAFTREQEAELQKMPGRVEIDTGDFDPLLGHSYGEIAGMSRSMHRSQGMGAAEPRGTMKASFLTVAGEPALKDPLDGVDVSWDRIPGTSALAELLQTAERLFSPEHPERAIAPLLQARPLLAKLDNLYARRRLRDLDETLALCAGLWLDAAADRAEVSPGGTRSIRLTALRRSQVPVTWKSVTWSGSTLAKPASLTVDSALAFNSPLSRPVDWRTSLEEPYSQPFWLVSPKQGDTYTIPSQDLIGVPDQPPVLEARFAVEIAGTAIELVRPVQNRYVDRVRGELNRALVVVPPVAVSAPETAVVFPDEKARKIEITVKAHADRRSGKLRLSAPQGWTVTPAFREFELAAGEQAIAAFDVTPPQSESLVRLKAVAELASGTVSSNVEVIDYDHIPPQTLFPQAEPRVVHARVRNLARRVGYIMGAGDEVPSALKQMGSEVTLLTDKDLVSSDLTGFDALVTGVRAWNTRAELRANRQRLFDYVRQGGTLLVQYNVREGGFMGGDPRALEIIGPYPIKIGTQRVTVEDAPVTFTNPASPLLEYPNRITPSDFAGWVQERGLYFANEWDTPYQTLLESHDPGEKPLAGGTLYARVGKGAYVFTAYSWFRQLPAGVPGAYRIFANLLSAGKSLGEDRNGANGTR